MEKLNEIDELFKTKVVNLRKESLERLSDLRKKTLTEINDMNNTLTELIKRNKKTIEYNISIDNAESQNSSLEVYNDLTNDEIKSEILKKHNLKIEVN